MATVTRENIGLLNDKITVTVAKDDYLPAFEKSIKTYTKQANIPGFRKGMVPLGMVKKMYGSSVFADEVIKSVEKGLQDYMVNEKLEIFAQPLPLEDNDPSKFDMNQPAEYAFAFEVGLKPEFNLPDLASLPLTKYNIEVTDEMVNEQMGLYLKNYGTKINKDEVSADDEEIKIEFTEADAEGYFAEDSKPKELTLQFKDFSASGKDLIRGKKVDEVFDAQLTQLFEGEKLQSVLKELGFAETDGEKYVHLDVSDITLHEDAVPGEELYKKAFPDKEIASEEDFKQEIKNLIAKQWDDQSVNQLHDQIYHALLKTDISFPEGFLKKWMLTQGAQGQQGQQLRTEEEVEAEFPKFVDSLRWNLVTDKIVTENNIIVEEADLRKATADQLLGYMGGQIDVTQPWINEYIDRMMKDQKYMQDLYQRVLIDKLFAWTVTQVHPTDQGISEEAFKKMVSEHHH